ncbi:MAG TPA: ribonuclease J [Thermomicrobiales bacterium]
MTEQSDTTHVRVIFLGGVGEVGKNMTVLECGDDIIIVDVGLGFPEAAMLGVDLLLPDITYLRDKLPRIRAIFITHGHEDHIGGLAYLLAELGNPPIYATRLTLGLIRVRLKERKLLGSADLRELDPESDVPVRAGVFAIDPFRVCHSIPDAVGFGIDTPAGLIVATGDFKFDQTPVDGRLTDLGKLAAFGRRGPLALISDCVHVETPGVTPSERTLEPTFARIFAEAPGRIIVATFASLISRVQQVLDIAARSGRKVAPVGRSIEKNVAMARDLGYLTPPPGTLIGQGEAAALPDRQVVYAVTGSQGEPTAALSRIASGEHRTITLQPGDTVIVSASPIPGNETAILRIVDDLFRQGSHVIYSAIERVHVSGHASQDELKLMLNLTRPRYVVPFHGESRHLALYGRLAERVGVPRERILHTRLGTALELGADGARPAGEVAAGHRYIAGSRVGTLSDQVFQERQALSRDGVVFVTVTIDASTGDLLAGPEIAARGFLPADVVAEAFALTRDRVREAVAGLGIDEHGAGRVNLNQRIKEETCAVIWEQVRRRPLVLPLVVEA